MQGAADELVGARSRLRLIREQDDRRLNPTLIARLVPEGARVLDLGCGDGTLLDLLQRERRCTGYGVEIADGNVLQCIRRGVDVIQLD